MYYLLYDCAFFARIFGMMEERSEVLKAIGERVRILRKLKGFSQEELAHNMGKDQPDLSRIERGEVNPGALTLIEIAHTLGVSPLEIFNHPTILKNDGERNNQ